MTYILPVLGDRHGLLVNIHQPKQRPAELVRRLPSPQYGELGMAAEATRRSGFPGGQPAGAAGTRASFQSKAKHQTEIPAPLRPAAPHRRPAHREFGWLPPITRNLFRGRFRGAWKGPRKCVCGGGGGEDNGVGMTWASELPPVVIWWLRDRWFRGCQSRHAPCTWLNGRSDWAHPVDFLFSWTEFTYTLYSLLCGLISRQLRRTWRLISHGK